MFLANKYYLDDLYEKVIVRAIAHPIARAAYWVNQHVIDGIVNGAGVAGKRGSAAASTATSTSASSTARSTAPAPSPTAPASALRPVQSGKVNQYGALLFGAAAVGAIVLVIVNV